MLEGERRVSKDVWMPWRYCAAVFALCASLPFVFASIPMAVFSRLFPKDSPLVPPLFLTAVRSSLSSNSPSSPPPLTPSSLLPKSLSPKSTNTPSLLTTKLLASWTPVPMSKSNDKSFLTPTTACSLLLAARTNGARSS